MKNLIEETRLVNKQKLQEKFESVDRLGSVYFVQGKYNGRAYSDLIHHLHRLYGLLPNVLILSQNGKYYFYGEEAYCDKLKAYWGGSKNNECYGLYSVEFPFNSKDRQISLINVADVLL